MEEFVMRIIEQAPTVGVLLYLLVRKDTLIDKLLDSCLHPCEHCREELKGGVPDSDKINGKP